MKPPLPQPDQFTSRLRSPAVAARVGLWLGISFGICFVTGLLSHYAQVPNQPVPFPSSPSWGYRVTQGLHVTSGTVAVPLLLVKLWSVFPKLFELPPSFRPRQLAVTALEKASIAVLVAAAVFQLATGLANTAQWYPWSFNFRTSHYAMGWVVIGALLVHIAVKLPITRDVLRGDVEDVVHDRDTAVDQGVLTRRGLLRSTWLAGGVAALATAGQSVPLLRRVSVFGVRSGDGPQGIPVNKSASSAGVIPMATSDRWRLTVTNGSRVISLSRPDLLAMPQHTERLPIACVEGWSASGEWTGVRVIDVLALVDAPPDSDLTISSFQPNGPYYTVNTLQRTFASDARTLLALHLDGQPLALDHGYPCRLIAPNRPGVYQTKWLGAVEVQT